MLRLVDMLIKSKFKILSEHCGPENEEKKRQRPVNIA